MGRGAAHPGRSQAMSVARASVNAIDRPFGETDTPAPSTSFVGRDVPGPVRRVLGGASENAPKLPRNPLMLRPGVPDGFLDDLVCSCVFVALLHGAEAEREEGFFKSQGQCSYWARSEFGMSATSAGASNSPARRWVQSAVAVRPRDRTGSRRGKAESAPRDTEVRANRRRDERGATLHHDV